MGRAAHVQPQRGVVRLGQVPIETEQQIAGERRGKDIAHNRRVDAVCLRAEGEVGVAEAALHHQVAVQAILGRKTEKLTGIPIVRGAGIDSQVAAPVLAPVAEAGGGAGHGHRRRRGRHRRAGADRVHRPHLEGMGRAVGETGKQLPMLYKFCWVAPGRAVGHRGAGGVAELVSQRGDVYPAGIRRIGPLQPHPAVTGGRGERTRHARHGKHRTARRVDITGRRLGGAAVVGEHHPHPDPVRHVVPGEGIGRGGGPSNVARPAALSLANC